MALVLKDRVQETATANTTVSFSLAGAVTGFQTFSSAIGNTNTAYYSATDIFGNWEVGIGTYATTGNLLTRTTILASSNANAAVTFSGTVNVFVTYPAGKSINLDGSGNATALGTPASGTVTNLTGTASININGTVGATTPAAGTFTSITATTGTITPATGTTTVPPIDFTAGTNLTTALAGAVEYDGNNFYVTSDTSQGRNVIFASQQFYLSGAGSALSGATQNFFGATSAASLAASSTYDIEAFCYFLKTTNGTIQWIPTFSSAITVGHSYLEYTPVSGFTTTVITGAMVVAEATQQTTTVLTHVATANLSNATYHVHKLRIRVVTNAACNFRLNNTIGTGSITPQAGSFYTVRKVITNAGNFVA